MRGRKRTATTVWWHRPPTRRWENFSVVVSAGLALLARRFSLATSERGRPRSNELLACGQKLHRRTATSRREQHGESAGQAAAHAQIVRVTDNLPRRPCQERQVRADQRESRSRHSERGIPLCSWPGRRWRSSEGLRCCGGGSSGRVGWLLRLGAVDQNAQAAIDRAFGRGRNRRCSKVGTQQVAQSTAQRWF